MYLLLILIAFLATISFSITPNYTATLIYNQSFQAVEDYKASLVYNQSFKGVYDYKSLLIYNQSFQGMWDYVVYPNFIQKFRGMQDYAAFLLYGDINFGFWFTKYYIIKPMWRCINETSNAEFHFFYNGSINNVFVYKDEIPLSDYTLENIDGLFVLKRGNFSLLGKVIKISVNNVTKNLFKICINFTSYMYNDSIPFYTLKCKEISIG